MLKVEQIERIRQAYYNEKKSMRQIAREFGHSRATVSQAIKGAGPRKYKQKAVRRAPVMGPYKERVKELLAESEKMPPKQRYTWRTIHKQIEKEGYQGSGSTLRAYIGRQRRSKRKPAVFMPLEFDPGTDAQVDWGQAQVIMKEEKVKVQLFLMRLSYSRRQFVMAFPNQKQESFFLGHKEAFHYFGGIPQRLTYDNLKAAVYRILRGKKREEQTRFVQFRSHYLFESHYCTPGQGHQKGGVEHGVGYARRNFLVPMPQVNSYQELNAYLLAECLKEDGRRVERQTMTIGQAWQEEQAHLGALPSQDHPCCVTLAVTLNPYSQVVIETNRYSVPTDRAAKQLLAKLYPFQIEICQPDQAEPIASHQRCYGRKQDILDPLHYLPLLRQRPGALAHAKPIRQWRQDWPAIYEQLLTKMETLWPDGRGIREFVRVLQLHQSHSPELIEKAIHQALDYGSLHFDGIALCLQQLSRPEPDLGRLDLKAHPNLEQIGCQEADLAGYNQLLGGELCQ